MSQTDIELWKQILKGNPDAWGDLVMRYQALVYAIPSRSGLSMPDCADCFQQTWVALYENRKKIKDPSRLSAWLVTTAKRETSRLLHLAKNDPDNPDSEDHADPALLPDEELIMLERQAHLEVAINELDPRCRKVVKAFFYSPERLSYEEIAGSLGIAPNSLGPVRRRCLERLRNILGELGIEGVRKEDFDTL
jgi:RNA polymerase sigma factor (sigma-70 family)